jgi:murein DD-endopeptidase MepM/ murein hydrolase activator NlpD
VIEGAAVTVRPGDTLFALARRTGADVADLVRANQLEAPFALRVGQTLKVPPLRYHVVAPGETGLQIARRYAVAWSLLAQLNDLPPTFAVRSGQRLRLPPILSAEDRAAQFDVVIAAASAGPAQTTKPQPVGTPSPPPPISEKAPPAAQADTEKPPSPAAPAPLPDAGPFRGQFAWPLNGRILSRFGAKGGGLYNDGINIAAKTGQTVRASSDGVVAYVGDAISGFGLLILIKHGDSWVTAYGHLSDALVKRGDKVRRGEPIGKAGQSGNVETPQLHFEIRQGRRAQDPVRLLPSVVDSRVDMELLRRSPQNQSA